ncbi:hypothetical protein HPT25_23455 [Bacillus sp. BRMEA1]|uniref:hypothetical protein n=1 Tax=Neobacillus endophyticus TaxID=2738405 RepID=UPI001566E2BD|nr:hypothetical protein [Neobacillus endophyticus]NRD80283.1 hypothetical protein [Neobacillus endophyticus]
MTQFNTADDQTVLVDKTDELADNQVKLSDGRVVEMRESTGADEMAVSAELGDTFQMNGGGMMIYQSCMIAKTITNIDGKSIPPMRGYAAYRDFAAGFKSKDWVKIKQLYNKLNGAAEGNV